MKSKYLLTVTAATLLATLAMGEEAAAPKAMSPLEIAHEYKAQLAVLNFDGLRPLMTKSEYFDEFKEEEDELSAAKKLGEDAYNAKLQEEKAEAKRDSDEMKILSETINGTKAFVVYEDTDDKEINYMLFVKKGDGPWLILETDEDDQRDAERFLKSRGRGAK